MSVSPTDGTGPTQGQRKTLTRVGIEPTTFGLNLALHVTLHYLQLTGREFQSLGAATAIGPAPV